MENNGEEVTEEMSPVEANIKIFKGVVGDAVPILKEIIDIKRDITKDINACAKFGLGRPAKELNATAKLLHDFESCVDKEDSKLYRSILHLKNTLEYFEAMGKGSIIQKLGVDAGIELDLIGDVADTLGADNIADATKAGDAYMSLFNGELPDDRLDLVTKLIDLAIDTHGEIVDKTNEVTSDLADPLVDTNISMATVVKAARLTIRHETKDDVCDKINAITESALLQSEALQAVQESLPQR
jgi:hypothetical protein